MFIYIRLVSSESVQLLCLRIGTGKKLLNEFCKWCLCVNEVWRYTILTFDTDESTNWKVTHAMLVVYISMFYILCVKPKSKHICDINKES